MIIQDIRGRTFETDKTPKRVVSLVPSVTETLFDLGAGDSVVGVTDYCVFPSALERPRVGGTKNLRLDQIRALAPDLVHMNLEENLRRHAEAIEQFAPVFVSQPKSIDDAAALITNLGILHDCQQRSGSLVGELREELASMPRLEFTFACPIWKKPWMWCGGDTYVASLLEATGGTNVLREHRRYPSIPLEDVRADVIFLPDEPYVFTTVDAEEVRRETGAKVIGPFPGHLVTWHGSRTIEGLRFLQTAFTVPRGKRQKESHARRNRGR